MLLNLLLTNCSKPLEEPTPPFLIQQIIDHLNSLISYSTLTQYISFVYSMLLLTQGINYKFLNVSVLTGILFTSCHEIIDIDNRYTQLIIDNKWTVVLFIIIISLIFIRLFDIIIYSLVLYGLFHLYDISIVFVNGRLVLGLVNFIFVLIIIMVYIVLNKSKDFLFSVLFSFVGTFGLIMSCEGLYGQEFGFSEVYEKSLSGVFDIKGGVVIGVCVVGVLIQMNKRLLK